MKDVMSAMVEEEGLVIKSANFEYEDNNGETEYWEESCELYEQIRFLGLNITEDEFVKRVEDNSIWEMVDVPENIKDKHPRIAVYENDDIQQILITDSFYDDYVNRKEKDEKDILANELLRMAIKEMMDARVEELKKEFPKHDALDEYFKKNCPKYYKSVRGELAC